MFLQRKFRPARNPFARRSAAKTLFSKTLRNPFRRQPKINSPETFIFYFFFFCHTSKKVKSKPKHRIFRFVGGVQSETYLKYNLNRSVSEPSIYVRNYVTDSISVDVVRAHVNKRVEL